jgi:hypothetical protein
MAARASDMPESVAIKQQSSLFWNKHLYAITVQPGKGDARKATV